MDNLTDRLHKSPFIRILIFLSAGILFAELIAVPKNLCYFLIPVSFCILELFVGNNYFKNEYLSGILVFSGFFTLGFSLAVNNRCEPGELTGNTFYAVLDEFPVKKDNSVKAVIRLADTRIKLISYFDDSEEILKGKPGMLLIFNRPPELIENNGNPFEFDYRKYALRNNIGHRVYLKNREYHLFPEIRLMNLKYHSLLIREKLLNRLAESGLSGEALDVISGITLGARENVDPETIKSFTRTGTMHVLAVSGGNVAVIYFLLNYIFLFLKKSRETRFLYVVLLLTGVWIYAIITGLSPSVLRASAMFSFIAIGNGLKRNPNVYNSLASSAFILLIINPFLLFDAGFQLSYAAVFAIVSIQPLIYRMVFLKSRISDWLWILFTVSVAAQLGTLPFCLYYFHQFPVFFWLTNLVVVPLICVFLYLSFITITLSLFSHGAALCGGYLLNLLGNGMLQFLRIAGNLPFAIIDNISVSISGILLISITILFLYQLFLKRHGRSLLYALAGLFLFGIFHTTSSVRTINRKEIVVFNVPGKILLAFTTGRETIWITDVGSSEFEHLGYFTKPYEINREIRRKEVISVNNHTNFINKDLAVRGDFINYRGVKILLKEKEDYNFKPKNNIIFIKTDVDKGLHLEGNCPIIKIRSPLRIYNKYAFTLPENCYPEGMKALMVTPDRKSFEKEGFEIGYFKP